MRASNRPQRFSTNVAKLNQSRGLCLEELTSEIGVLIVSMRKQNTSG